MNKKECFTIADKEYAVIFPGAKEAREAQKVYDISFAKSVSQKLLLRASLDKFMEEQGIWDKEQQKKYTDTINIINTNEMKLQKGGIKLSEARKIAIEMREKRVELQTLLTKRNELDVNTVEGKADNARFNALVSICLVYNDTGKPVYANVDDYLENSGDEVAFKAAQTLATMTTNFNKNYEDLLPENKFLKKWKFSDEENRLVNKDGKLVDQEGKLINEDGYYVDADGNTVDTDGNRIDKDGNYVVETSPFLDDDGNEMVEEEEEKMVEEAKTAETEVVAEEEGTSPA